MSTRPNPLREAMHNLQGKPSQQQPASVIEMRQPEERRAVQPAPSRVGKRSVSGHFTPEVARQLRILAAETDRTSQDLLEEALNDLFRKYAKSAIA